MPKLTQSKNWCFTDFELLDIEKIYNENKDIVRYMCRGLEVCPTTGRKHYQGWVQFLNKKRMGGVKRLFGSKKISVRACKGDEYSNDAYCKKDNDYKAWGLFITQGARSDLEDIKRRLDAEQDMKQIADEHFGDYLRYHKGMEAYRALVQKQNSKAFRHVEVEVIVGTTGLGKTREAMKHAEYKIEGSKLQWWDGYEGEQCILIDEYDSQVPITELLNLLDGYQLRLPVKGSFVYARWTKVYITSNIEPEHWHSNAKDVHRDALMRRITKITKMC